MSDIILKVENISKQYRLGTVGSGTLKDDFKRNWAKILGKEDPFLKVGEVNDRTKKSTGDYVWALRDINFEVKQGEVLGIIGKNGAGKSTLLKILSRVTMPTTGIIKSRGRIASLLEVGTGFHPELTGRENIFLNGAILGMTKFEINRKLEEIIEFSGCERYIDTPTKRYSSGMTVRLAFAVAAHLEPEILVVDEVLAVGDAEFQKKAIGKMQYISQGEGRTVLFVSHNMASVKKLCSRGILLENGSSVFQGSVDESITKYLSLDSTDLIYNRFFNNDEDKYIKEVRIKGENDSNVIVSGEKVEFEIFLRDKNKFKLNIHLGIYDSQGDKILNLSSEYTENAFLDSNQEKHICKLSKNPLVEGVYSVNILLLDEKEKIEHHSNVFQFKVLNGDFYGVGKLTEKMPSKVFVEQIWK